MSDTTVDESTTQADVSVESPAPSPAPAPESAPAPAPAPIDPPAPPVYIAPPVSPPAAPSLSLDDYMQNLSRQDSRVSLVNAFAMDAHGKDMNRATAAEFQAAYVAFCNAPA